VGLVHCAGRREAKWGGWSMSFVGTLWQAFFLKLGIPPTPPQYETGVI
jgi:hypothetical protein